MTCVQITFFNVFLYTVLLMTPSFQFDFATESALSSVHSISSNALGTQCYVNKWILLSVGLNTSSYQCTRDQLNLASSLLFSFKIKPSLDILDAITHGLLNAINNSVTTRLIHISGMNEFKNKQVHLETVHSRLNSDTKTNINDTSWWKTIGGDLLFKHVVNEMGNNVWSNPYYGCIEKKWMVTYSTLIANSHEEDNSRSGYILSLDLDISNLEINQCDEYFDNEKQLQTPLSLFHGSHKCPEETTRCVHKAGRGWSRGSYVCKCKDGFYSLTHPNGFNGSLMEIAWIELNKSEYNNSDDWKLLNCIPCAEGCVTCKGPKPCMATYGWELRTFLLCISIWCAACTFALAVFLYHHRRARVFRSASPIFLAITLLGCVIMYFEMLAIYPVLNMYFCIATKWCRHLGFCITYTALLMKTWRVSLTYRVKSAHAVKLTERQLLRWLTPVLLIMLVYLGTWTISDPPQAEKISDSEGLLFKQCTYNWWDHSLAFGELLFLLWGVKVCYGVRHAESLYNEAKLISFAIYNIAFVNCLMVTFHLLIFPQVGPDMKYFLGFLRTQLSTTVTIAIVFGPKVVLIWRGFGDQWDNKTSRGLSSSFSLNGIGIHPRIPLTPHDLAQENDELKEEIQKLAAQIEFMKIVQMELHNRHLKPKPGGHFTLNSSQQATEQQLKPG